jgi:hypothetical protein
MLRFIVSTLSACALAGTIGVFAQQQTPTQPQKEQEQQPPPAATLTGCVQEAKTTDGGTAFILNKAQGGTAQMYVLAAPEQGELAKHLNHKVEVTGQVQEPRPPAASPDAAPADPKVLRPPIVQVESVKMVAESCQ